jgi:hypothetical protein
MRVALLIVVMMFMVGCEATIDGGEGSSTEVVSTVNVGLERITYEYLEVYDSKGTFYRLYDLTEYRSIDTAYIDVVSGDSVTFMTHYYDDGESEVYDIFKCELVDDSIYWLKE